MAKAQHTTSTRVLSSLVEAGLKSQDAELKRLTFLVDQLAVTEDPDERQKIKKKLAKITFGPQ